jgi:hypothetical protein
MSPVNPVALALMPVSQLVSWKLIQSETYPLYPTISGIAAFYCVWALYNLWIEGNHRELGHISMGLLAVAAYFEKRNLTIAATGLVIINFFLPVLYLVPMSAHDMAKLIKESTSTWAIVWAYIFKLYLLSNLALFSTILYKVVQPQSINNSYTSVSSSASS